MRVKCISLLPDDKQAKHLGIGINYYPGMMEFDLTIGQEYLVYSISILGGVPWIDVLGQSIGCIHSVPLCLFNIVDGSVSNLWIAKINEKGNFFLWPSSFYTPYYHDDLSNGIKEIVDDFKQVEQLLIEEENSRSKNNK